MGDSTGRSCLVVAVVPADGATAENVLAMCAATKNSLDDLDLRWHESKARSVQTDISIVLLNTPVEVTIDNTVPLGRSAHKGTADNDEEDDSRFTVLLSLSVAQLELSPDTGGMQLSMLTSHVKSLSA